MGDAFLINSWQCFSNLKGKVGDGHETVQQVHGLTTAAGVWLSAAVGVGAGGRLYFVSAYSVSALL